MYNVCKRSWKYKKLLYSRASWHSTLFQTLPSCLVRICLLALALHFSVAPLDDRRRRCLLFIPFYHPPEAVRREVLARHGESGEVGKVELRTIF